MSETLHVVEREEPTPTAEPLIPSNLKLKIIALDGLIVAYFRRVLVVTRTPPSVALE
jgi:hypothetical protein